MSSSSFCSLGLFLLVVAGCDGQTGKTGEGPGADDVANKDAGKKVFDDSTVHTIEIEMSSSDWKAIEEAADAYENVNAEFPYFAGTMSFDGVELAADVGVRLKGHISIPLTEGHSYPLKVDFNRYEDNQTLDGLKKLNLNTNFNGPPLPIMRDFISYNAWREFDVEASRTAFTKVTVNGEELGTYVMVEQVDGGFIKRNFDSPYGQLYKPEQQSGHLGYQGDRIEDYPEINHKWPDEPDHEPLLNAIEVLDHGSQEELAKVFDVEGVLTYLAGNVVLASFDYYAITGHNYYLYEENPGQFTMLPWDMNGSLDPGGATLLCSPYQGLLSSRLLQDADIEALYFDTVDEFLKTAGSDDALFERFDAAYDLVGSEFEEHSWEALEHQIIERSSLLEEELGSSSGCSIDQ